MESSMLTSDFVLPVHPRCRLGVVFVAAALLMAAALPAAATFPPEYHFRSVTSARVTIHFHEGLEPMAREAAAMADEILAGYERRYRYHIGRVQLVLADDEDDPNGFTTPLPYPLVHLRAAAPDASEDFGNLESWLRLLLTHELAHSIHLDQARGIVRAGRSVFGRAPFLFPNALTPQWLIEGLATYEETEGTAFGRGRNPDSLMIRRMAVLENAYPREDRATTGLEDWPFGQAPYLFGEGFLRDLTMRFGSITLPLIAHVHAGWPIPFFDELTGHRVTGGSFHVRWREFMRSEAQTFEAEAARIRARGLTDSCAWTTRGVRQLGPRVSPDGTQIAYTNSHLGRRRAIVLLTRETGRERRLVERNGGTGLSWTPDGRALVYDELEVDRLYRNYYDLRRVDVATGRVRRLTRGLRARDPEVSPDGRQVVFVRRYPDRSELSVIDLDGGSARDLTASDPGVQWSGPTWARDGTAVVASRWRTGGWSDLVRVSTDASADLLELTHDRARDVEPAWTPDGRFLVFRSDRDGVSNVYARREDDGALFQVTNVLGGAFTPVVGPDGRLFFSSYSARGYDVHEAAVDWDALPPAAPFVDRYPPPRPAVAPVEAAARPYRPLPFLAPRSWTPYFVGGTNTRLGAATAGTDPLLRHAWGAQAYRSNHGGRLGGTAFYLYDRFRPQLFVFAQDDVEEEGDAIDRTRELTVRLTLPLARTRRSAHQLSLAWRRSRSQAAAGTLDPVDLGGMELAWAWSHDVQEFPYSISPSQGQRIRVSALREDPRLGSDLALVKTVVDVRAYQRVLGETDVLAFKAGAGTTFGRPQFQRSFAAGGFPDGSVFDLVRTNYALLRGYPDDVFTGRRFATANVEYRFPLAHPQHGFWSLPFFLRHLHGAVFADAADAWNDTFHPRDLKTAAGASVGADMFLGHAIPVTSVLGIAHGFGLLGDTRAYMRVGLAF
jgi:Tol biopolymer transport system component